MVEYKRNHTVPRFILEYWVDPATPHQGVHVHEIRRQRSYVSTGLGRKPFSFAICDDLYVNTANGVRAVGVERWFSTLEGSLASLSRMAHARAPIVHATLAARTKTVMAILGMECRSPYNLAKIRERLDQDIDLRTFLDPDSPVPAEQQVLENLVAQVSELLSYFTPIQMTFLVAPEARSWITCDRPYFHREGIDERFLVLTNKIMLVYGRAEQEDEFQYVDASPDFFEFMNHRISLEARHWLVADSREALDQYVPVFKTDEWRETAAADHIAFLPVRHLRSGWRVNR
jgi:hypothetical protein